MRKYEINFLTEMLEKKQSSQKVPIIYSTSFLLFSKNNEVAKGLTSR